MSRKVSEKQLRMLIRESLASDVWSGIKRGVGRAYDYVADVFDIEEPEEEGILAKLDRLSPDVTKMVTPGMRAAKSRSTSRRSEPGKMSAAIVGDSQAGTRLGDMLENLISGIGFSTSVESRTGALGAEIADLVASVAPQNDLVVMMFGGNDPSPNSAVAAVERAYKACQESGTYLIVIGPPPATIITNSQAAQAAFGPNAEDPNYHLKREGGRYPEKRIEIARAIESAANGKAGISAYGIAVHKSPNEPTYSSDYYPAQADGIHCDVGAEAIANDIFDDLNIDEIAEDLRRADVQVGDESAGLPDADAIVDSYGTFAGGSVTQEIRNKSRIPFNERQFKMMQLIEDLLTREGFTPAAIVGALASAYAESNFNPIAVGDSGDSIGLFQLNIRGAGSGMSVQERMDPVKNTERIAQTAKRSRFMDYMSSTSDVQVLAAAWSKYVERPRDQQGEMEKRAEIAKDIIGLPDAGSVETSNV